MDLPAPVTLAGVIDYCCVRKRKSAEQREYDDLRHKLAQKQEEVRRLQEQCDELNQNREPPSSEAATFK